MAASETPKEFFERSQALIAALMKIDSYYRKSVAGTREAMVR